MTDNLSILLSQQNPNDRPPSEGPPHSHGNQPAQQASQQHRETILVVENDPSLRTMMVYALQWHGYHVLEATNHLDAEALVKNFRGSIDVIVMDVFLTEANGYDVAKSLLQIKPIRSILFISGITQNHELNRGSIPARNMFLIKPFTPNTLVLKIRALLDTDSAS